MPNQKKCILCLLLVSCLLAIGLMDSSVALAADDLLNNTEMFDFGAGQTIGTSGSLSEQLYQIASGLSSAGHIIIVIMTVVAGCMVVFGLEDGKKVMWSYILGIGLAINFGGFLMDSGMFGDMMKSTGTPSPVDNAALESIVEIKQNGATDILSNFMAYYNGLIVENGKAFLVPIAFKLTIILASIDASIKLAMDMISGDKIKFMISTTLKVGFYLFMIDNWITFAGAWSGFCQYIGFQAGGAGTVDANLKPDSIWKNGLEMFNTIVSGANAGGKGASTVGTIVNAAATAAVPGAAIVIILCVIAMIICLFLTAIEMFLARVEFYTMVMIGIIMLPFGVCDKLEFLSRQAISAVFNLGAKVMVISFIQAMATALLTKYVEKFISAFTSGGAGAHFPILLQMTLLCAVLFVITKKIPDLVSGFLNGSPALSGSSMQDMLVKAGNAAAKVNNVATMGTGFVAGAAANAIVRGRAQGKSGAGLLMSALGGTGMNVARAAGLALATKNPVVGGFNKGVQMALQADGLVSSQAKPKSVDGHSLLNATKKVLGGTDENGAATGNDMFSLLVNGGVRSKSEEDDSKSAGGTGGNGKNFTSKEPQPVNSMNNTSKDNSYRKEDASTAGAEAGRQAGAQAGAAEAANTPAKPSTEPKKSTPKNNDVFSPK